MASDKLTVTHLLLPVALVALGFTGFLVFQTKLLVDDRTALHQSFDQQQKALDQVDKIKLQANALAVGTLKLAQQGNKDAQNIIAEMKKAGIDVKDQSASAPSAPAAP